MQPAIYGLSGESLTADERDFFRDANPAGYILFKRNCAQKAQLRNLTDTLRSIHGRDDLPILIDQEGGRVARMQPPVWPAFPKAELFAQLYEVAPISAIEAARANAQAIAVLLKECGITADCMPLLDVRQAGAHDIIGDRALGEEPMQVAALGRAALEGMRDGGVVGVVKHMPGHGRATSDSHVGLPVVQAPEDALETDLQPFRALKHAPVGMVAHVVYTAWDPTRCASLSRKLISEIIRTRIGFDGLLMSDDVGMRALSGTFAERARGVLQAGCDLALHCSGVLDEMLVVANGLPEMSPQARGRLDRAMATVADRAKTGDYQELAAKRDELLAFA